MKLDPDFRTAVADIFDETYSLTLATKEASGAPRATPLFFAYQFPLRLIFLSDPETPHMQNLERSATAAAALYPEVRDYQKIRGVQVKGRVAEVPPELYEESMAIYQLRFSFIQKLPAALESSQLYHLQPTWLRLIDNRQGFGYKQEAGEP